MAKRSQPGNRRPTNGSQMNKTKVIPNADRSKTKVEATAYAVSSGSRVAQIVRKDRRAHAPIHDDTTVTSETDG
jgi:hypothetical protein